MQYNESGWLFQKEHGTIQNITKEVSYDDLHDLLIEADKDNAWAESVRQEVVYRDKVFNGEMKNPSHHIDPIIDYFRVVNTGGTVTHYPFGRIITFASRRHLFRGENQRYSYSESTLSRKVRGKSREEAELLHVVANMRVVQFRKLIWNINVVPYWEAKVSEVNYKALAQHYGLDTYLLDLTNDFRIALFFATCKYEDGEYRPLTEDDIKASERSKYGVIFQTPDWVADYMQPRGAYQLDHINSLYDNRDLLAPVGNMLHVLPEDKKFREERCREIYGKLI